MTQGFAHHVKCEHNMWAYIFFLIHLDDTKPNDYTALDLYVSVLVSLAINIAEFKMEQRSKAVSICND